MREKSLSARFHWGKHFNHDHEEIQNLYPNLEEFADFRSQLDPNKIISFVNEFLEEKFQFTKAKKMQSRIAYKNHKHCTQLIFM